MKIDNGTNIIFINNIMKDNCEIRKVNILQLKYPKEMEEIKYTRSNLKESRRRSELRSLIKAVVIGQNSQYCKDKYYMRC